MGNKKSKTSSGSPSEFKETRSETTNTLEKKETRSETTNTLEKKETRSETTNPLEKKNRRPDPFSIWKIQDMRNEMRMMRAELSTYLQNGPLRIVLCGDAYAGKSSVVNNILTAFKGRIVQTAIVGSGLRQITKTYSEYKMHLEGQNDDQAGLVVCDTHGIDGIEDKRQVQAIKDALSGNYAPNENMDDTENTSKKQIRTKAVYIIFVIDALDVIKGEDNGYEWARHLDAIQSFASRESIPASVFLTKCDLLDQNVSRSIETLYKSDRVEEMSKIVHQKLDIVPRNRIFPLVNYTDQMEPELPMMLQTLYALKYILIDVESCMADVVR